MVVKKVPLEAKIKNIRESFTNGDFGSQRYLVIQLEPSQNTQDVPDIRVPMANTPIYLNMVVEAFKEGKSVNFSGDLFYDTHNIFYKIISLMAGKNLKESTDIGFKGILVVDGNNSSYGIAYTYSPLNGKRNFDISMMPKDNP